MNSCCVMDETADVGRSVSGQTHTHAHTHTHTHTHIHTHLLLNPSLWIMSEWAAALNTHFNASSLHVLTYLSFTVFSVHLKQMPSVLFYTNKLMQRIINGYTLKKRIFRH